MTSLRFPPRPAALPLKPLTHRAIAQERGPRAVVDPTGSAGERLRTDRLVIRPYTTADMDSFVRAVGASRAELDRFHPLHLPMESDAALFHRQVCASILGDINASAWRRLIVAPNGEVIGAVSLNAIHYALESSAEMSLWIATPHQRRGYAREALGAVARFAFADAPLGLGLQCVRALVSPDNVPSIGLFAGEGFRPAPQAPSINIRTKRGWTPHHVLLRFAPMTSAASGCAASIERASSGADTGGGGCGEKKPVELAARFPGLAEILRTEIGAPRGSASD